MAGWFLGIGVTLLTTPYDPIGQLLEPPDGPGLGVELDKEKLAAYGAKWA